MLEASYRTAHERFEKRTALGIARFSPLRNMNSSRRNMNSAAENMNSVVENMHPVPANMLFLHRD